MSNPQAMEWLPRYAARIQREDEVERLTAMVNDKIVAAVPDVVLDEGMQAELRGAIRAHWRGLLAQLGRDSFVASPPAEALDWSRTAARRGLDIGTVLKTYRVGQRAVWDHITSALEKEIHDVELCSAVLVRFWDRVTQWLDTAMDVVVVSHAEEREQWQRGAAARRAEVVRSILRGESVDIDIATTELGHSLRWHQTAFAVWADEVCPDTKIMHTLERLAGELGAALGTPHPLTLPSGSRGLRAWVATPRPPAPNRLTDPRSPCDGVRAAVGSRAPGLVGFRRSHREALAAQQVAISGRHDRVLTHYSDVELVSLASGQGMDAIRALVERELHGLAEPDAATARLRETVALFLANDGNVRTTARLLGVHPNTVRYRVHQAEQLLGHSVGTRRTYLDLALRCADSYGEQVLPTDTQQTARR